MDGMRAIGSSVRDGDGWLPFDVRVSTDAGGSFCVACVDSYRSSAGSLEGKEMRKSGSGVVLVGVDDEGDRRRIQQRALATTQQPTTC